MKEEEEEQKELDDILIHASSYSYLEIVKYLVEKGANVHAEKNRSLIKALWNGNLEIAKYLIEKGADIHDDNDEALIQVAYKGDLEVVKYFILELGCDINIFLKVATDYKKDEIINWCKSYIEIKNLKQKLDTELKSTDVITKRSKI